MALALEALAALLNASGSVWTVILVGVAILFLSGMICGYAALRRSEKWQWLGRCGILFNLLALWSHLAG
jgi:hypothetical protein